MKKDTKITQFLNENLADVVVTEQMHHRMMNEIMEGRKMSKKLSVGLVFAIVLLAVSIAALAVVTMRAFTNKVADMSLDGVFDTWGLEDKQLFIEAMREAGLAMDETLYEALANPGLDEETRNEAANQIIDDRYGDMMREMDAFSVEPSTESVYGKAPDTWLIFHDAYFADYPDATQQEVTDAYAYWLRDLGRRYEQLIAGVKQEKPVVDEAYAAFMTEMYLMDYFSVPEEETDRLNTHVEYNAEFDVWVCTTSLRKEDIPDRPSNRDREIWLTDLGDAWEAPVVVDAEGRPWPNCTLEKYLEAKATEQLWNYDGDELEEIARQAVMDTFGKSAEEMDRYFADHVNEGYVDENRYALYTVLFKEHHTSMFNDWTYAVMVSAGTGEVLECIDPVGLWAKLPGYVEIYPTLTREERVARERWLLYPVFNPFGGYENWTEAQKAEWKQLLSLYKDKAEWNDLLSLYKVNGGELPAGTLCFADRGDQQYLIPSCSVTPLRDGGFLAIGRIRTDAGAEDAWAARVSSAGETLWEVQNGDGLCFEAAVAMPDGTFLLAMTPQKGEAFSLAVVTLDASGHKLGEPVALEAKGFASAGKDCLLVRREFVSYATPVVLLAVNGKGETLWERNYDELIGAGFWIYPAADGYLLAGNAQDKPYNQTTNIGMMARLDDQGHLLWMKRMEERDNGFLTCALETVDGGIFAGWDISAYGEDAEAAEPSWLVTRFDAEGNALWRQGYPQSAPPAELRLMALLPAPEDGVLAVAAGYDPEARNNLHFILLDREGTVQAEWQQKMADFPILFGKFVTIGGQSYLIYCDDPSYGSGNTYLSPLSTDIPEQKPLYTLKLLG